MTPQQQPPASPRRSTDSLHPLPQARVRRSHPSSGTATPTTGSATQTLTSTSPRSSTSPDPLVLRLRGQHNARRHVNTQEENTEVDGEATEGSTKRRRGIKWADDVVDNEGLGRKSSKVCCIYHRPKGVNESSSEDDSSSDDSDAGGGSDGSDGDDGRARMGGKGKRRHKHDHEHGDECAERGEDKGKTRTSPNAYEKMPRYKKG